MPDFREIRIVYDFETDEVEIDISKKFSDLPAIHRADALKDAIWDLTKIYNEVFRYFINYYHFNITSLIPFTISN